MAWEDTADTVAWVATRSFASTINNSLGAPKGAFFCGKMPLDRLPLETSHKGAAFPRMKAKVIITPKAEVLDPQGKTVQGALEQMGCESVRDVRIGKYIEIEMEGDRASVEKSLDEYADKFLANPNIEHYRLVFED